MKHTSMEHLSTKSIFSTSACIVGIGEALWDVLPEGKKLGGAPANFAYHVAQLGLEGRVVSAVGADVLGQEIRETFATQSLQGLLETVPYPTGTVQVALDEAGVPTYTIREGVAWDNLPFTPALEALARQTRAVCFGSLAQREAVTRHTLYRFLDAMPTGEGIYRIFDINLRQHFYTPEVVETSLHRCNVLKINDEEFDVVSRMLDLPGRSYVERSRQLMDRYALELLILTCGAKGSFVFTPTSQSFLPTPHVQVADTVGAGDAFTAAFLVALLDGQSVEAAHRLAVEVAAYVCTQPGAMPVLPSSFREMLNTQIK